MTKVSLITGAGIGIGRASALAFAKAGRTTRKMPLRSMSNV